MTEITKEKEAISLSQLPPAMQRFVLQWGDMGGQWGVNRSIAQIHALLYLWETPITAEEISEILGIARSNVSNSLRELQQWKIIRRVPVPGDRRDHFVAEKDVWEMAFRIAAVRKQKEFDPAISTLEECIAEAEGDAAVSAEVTERLEEMLKFTRSMDSWFGQMLKVPHSTLVKMIRMGDRVVGFLGFAGGKSDREKAG